MSIAELITRDDNPKIVVLSALSGTTNALVGIGENPKGVGFAVSVTLNISLPNMDKAAAESLVEKAHQVCPYSNATRGNVDVTLNLV